VAKHLDVSVKKSNLPQLFAYWLLGIGLGDACLFGLGALIFADWQRAIIYGVVILVCAWSINWLLKRTEIL
jgi:solute:Na+ symporter, SSS family